jgi:hypothetical protein
MHYSKKSDGYILTKTNDLNIFEVGFNGFILIHNKLNIMAFTNSLKQNSQKILADYEGFRILFDEDLSNYKTHIVLQNKIILEPSVEQKMIVEGKMLLTIFTKVGLKLNEKGFVKVEDLTVFSK